MTCDPIPQQAGPGEGAELVLVPRKITPEIEAAIKEVAPKWNAPSVWGSLLDAALAVEDSRERDQPHCRVQSRPLTDEQRKMLSCPGVDFIPGRQDSRERCASSDAKDAQRYRWLRNRLSIEDVEFMHDRYLGSHDEAESVKCDTAVDSAMAAVSSGAQPEQQQGQGLVHTAMSTSDRTSVKGGVNAPSGEGYAWLVERREQGRTTGFLGWSLGSLEWFATASQATRFVRREDANGVAEMFDDLDVIIAEHIWG